MYNCDLAEDFASAREKLEFYDYDCILLVITLPNGNVLKLLQFLKDEKSPND